MTKNLSYSDLQKGGYKLAKIVANRPIDDDNVKDKMADMRKIGAIESVKVVKAADALNEGLDLVDFKNPTIPVTAKNAQKYLAIPDGQNRTTAHINLLAERDNNGEPTYNKDLILEFLPEDREYTIMEYICRVNDPGHTWRLDDYAHGAGELHKDIPTLAFIAELVNNDKFPCSSAAKWATLNRRITSSMVREAVNSKGVVDSQFSVDVNLADGKRLVKAAKQTFAMKVVKNRTLVDWVIDQLADKEEVDNLERFFLQITPEQADNLRNIKGVKGGESKETMVKKMLSTLYQNMKEGL